VFFFYNRNYIGILELLSEFDAFLEEHFKLYGDPENGKSSYLSANVCGEFIKYLGAILEEIKES